MVFDILNTFQIKVDISLPRNEVSTKLDLLFIDQLRNISKSISVDEIKGRNKNCNKQTEFFEEKNLDVIRYAKVLFIAHSWSDWLVEAMGSTLLLLKDINPDLKIYLVGTKYFGKDLSKFRFYSKSFAEKYSFNLPSKVLNSEIKLKKLAKKNGIEYISSLSLGYKNVKCSPIKDTKFISFDGTHLNSN